MDFRIRGNKDLSNRIKRVFETLHYNTTGFNFDDETKVYFTVDRNRINTATCDSLFAQLLFESKRYKDLPTDVTPIYTVGDTLMKRFTDVGFDKSFEYTVEEVDIKNQRYIVKTENDYPDEVNWLPFIEQNDWFATVKEKQVNSDMLLFKDLSARLPYGVIVSVKETDVNGGIIEKCSGVLENVYADDNGFVKAMVNGWEYDIKDIMPYLRSMRSLTNEEQKLAFEAIDHYGEIDFEGDIDCLEHEYVFVETCSDYIDWLNEHHFDYRDLIKKDMAIKVDEENNPYNKE